MLFELLEAFLFSVVIAPLVSWPVLMVIPHHEPKTHQVNNFQKWTHVVLITTLILMVVICLAVASLMIGIGGE